ncbi:MAG: hypothetical protein KDD63_09175, partial [Bacteroidetes bacterium]|nr:hypothetical protein [Bacteroidota bacterium]
FIIIEYIVENKGAQPLDSLYGGLFADWDISVFADPVNFFPTTKNASDFDVKSKLVFAYDRIGLDPNYYGLSMISDKSFHAFATTNPSNNFSFDTQGKFQALSNSPNPQTATIGVNNGGEDIMHFISGGPFRLEPGEKDTLAFALMGN